jgi:hypothetical protein
MLIIFLRAAVAFAMAVFISCSSIPEDVNLKPKTFFEKDLRIEVNDEEFVGVGVPAEAVTYEIKVIAKSKIDYIDFKTCGRFRRYENKGKKITFHYTPMEGIETRGDCFLDIFVGNKKGLSGWARIAFRYGNKWNLSSYLRCNGWEGLVSGTSICDALSGLEANIKFSKPVVTQKSGPCVMPKSDDKMLFKWNIQKGDCAYLFKEIGEENWHVLYLSGFERSPYRAGK